MRASVSVVVLLGALLASGAGLAAEDAGGRYTMSPADGGVVRLDTETGAVALCKRKDGDRWACEDMEDGQLALLSEIDRLKAENKSLKGQVEDLEETLGLGESDSSAAPKPKLALPTEEDVDKAFDYLEGMLRKLRERVERLEIEHGHGRGRAL